MVRLHFAEPHSATLAEADGRNMTVKVEGQTVLSNFNPGIAAGAVAKAYVWEKDIAVSDGNGIKIEFIDTGGDAFVMGIEVIGGGGVGISDLRFANADCPALPIQIQVTPNPVHKALTFRIKGRSIQNMDARLFGFDGEPMPVRFEATAGKNEYTGDLQGLPDGVYLLKVYTKEGVVSRKVVVTK